MAGIIKIRLDDPAVRRELARLAAQSENLTPVLQEFAQIILRSITKNVQQGGRYTPGALQELRGGGERWAPLAGSTIAERRRLGYWPGKILQRTGQGQQSIQVRVDTNRVIVSSNKPYMRAHQFGATVRVPAYTRTYYFERVKKGKRTVIRWAKKGRHDFTRTVRVPGRTFQVPARPWLLLQDEDVEQMLLALRRYIRRTYG